jgi:GH43 family beta-xylosidase
MGYVKVCTRDAAGKQYPEELAYSVHFAFSRDAKAFEPLNRNYGILFAKAAVRADNTLAVKMLGEPAIFFQNGKFHIVARQLDKGAVPDTAARGKLLYWTSADLVDFAEHGLAAVNRIEGYPGKNSDTVEVDDEALRRIIAAWSPYPSGETEKESGFAFPLAKGTADPVVFHWRAHWYFISTNDNNGNIGFLVRRAGSVSDLFATGAEEHRILDLDAKRGLIQTFWAPEFHVIGGRLYLLFAVSGDAWGPQCRMMRLKENGEIIRADDWEDPVTVVRKDGGVLGAGGITLDMTHLRAAGRLYLVWSQRWGIGTPLDSGSMLFIAEADPGNPWRLASDPVLLSRPLYGWENQSGTINNEGPFPLYRGDTIHLSYSGGDARGFAYSIGFLRVKRNADLLDPAAWKKSPSPALTSFCLKGQYGPGHNSFFEDERGRTWIAYHAELYPDKGPACAAIRRVYFDEEGRPRLDFTGSERPW